MTDRVVLAEQLAASREVLRQIWGARVRPERLVEAVVLEEDHEDTSRMRALPLALAVAVAAGGEQQQGDHEPTQARNVARIARR